MTTGLLHENYHNARRRRDEAGRRVGELTGLIRVAHELLSEWPKMIEELGPENGLPGKLTNLAAEVRGELPALAHVAEALEEFRLAYSELLIAWRHLPDGHGIPKPTLWPTMY